MLQWIKMLNKMYEEHSYTSDGRVAVSYCEDLRVVVVKVYDDYHIIKADDFNDLGLLDEIHRIVYSGC
jgi:tRNA(Ile2) C34 agmatinyltransferase TiaS